MGTFTVLNDSQGVLYWESRNRHAKCYGDVLPDGTYHILRIVHLETTNCGRNMVDAKDEPGGLAHIGCCHARA
jgi:hypothetical protein